MVAPRNILADRNGDLRCKLVLGETSFLAQHADVVWRLTRHRSYLVGTGQYLSFEIW
jgi:hypothetical protein